eukprot:COSAG02_NODE_3418_length_6778_cov_36.646654_3_plen_102_part_00
MTLYHKVCDSLDATSVRTLPIRSKPDARRDGQLVDEQFGEEPCTLILDDARVLCNAFTVLVSRHDPMRAMLQLLACSNCGGPSRRRSKRSLRHGSVHSSVV